MRMSWIDLLIAFEIDITNGGGADFAELVLRLINHWRWTGEYGQVGKISAAMCKERGCFPRIFYMKMKRAIKPLLNSDDAALEFWDIFPKKRTTTMMAVAIAEREIKYMESKK